jgi:hypothetical protein
MCSRLGFTFAFGGSYLVEISLTHDFEARGGNGTGAAFTGQPNFFNKLDYSVSLNTSAGSKVLYSGSKADDNSESPTSNYLAWSVSSPSKEVKFFAEVGSKVQIPISIDGEAVTWQGGATGIARGAVWAGIDLQFKALPTDLAAGDLEWDGQGDATFSYSVRPTAFSIPFTVNLFDLPAPTTVAAYWASGTTLNSKIGGPVFTAATGTARGDYGPITIPAANLQNRPPNATHLLLACDPDNDIAELLEDNNVTALLLPAPPVDTAATSLSWEVLAGGVTLKYTNSAALPTTGGPYTFNLYWVDENGSKVSDRLLPGNNDMIRSQGPHSKYVPSLTPPPSNARGLLLVMDDLGNLTESSESNNTKLLAYDPTVQLVSVRYDGEGSPTDNVIGRFFAGLSISNDATVQLSDSLRALGAVVTAEYTPGTPTVTTGANGMYTLQFDVGQVDGDIPLTVTAKVGITEQANLPLTVKTVKVPKWYEAAGPRGSLTWSPANGQYSFSAPVVDIGVGNLFQVPAGVPIIGGKQLGTFDVTLTLTADTTLNPTACETSGWSFTANAKWLTTTLFQANYTQSGGPMTVTLDLDNRTLEITSAVFRYQRPSTPLRDDQGNIVSLNLFAGDVLTGVAGYLKATSQLTLTPNLAADVRLEFDAQTGKLVQGAKSGTTLTGSYAQAKLDGAIGGNLASIGLVANPVWLTNAARLAMAAFGQPLSLIGQAGQWLATQLGLGPSLDFQLTPTTNSSVSLTGEVLLGAQTTVTGAASVDLKVTGQIVFRFAGQTYPLHQFGNSLLILNNEFSVNRPWTW